MNKKALGNILLILTAFIWGTAFVGQRQGMEHMGPITFNACRMALAALTIGTVSFVLRKRDAQKQQDMSDQSRREYRKNTVIGGVCCGFFLTIAALFQQMGMVYTTAGKGGFITAMYILLVPVINWILFKRKSRPLVWIAVLMGIAGIYLLCVTEGLTLEKGDALVMVCPFFFAGHILCCDYFVQRANPVELSAIQFFTVTVLSTIMAFIVENPTWQQVTAAIVPIVWLGVLSSGTGYTLQIIAQQWTDPTVASLLMSLEAVFAVMGGAVLLGERMSARELIGAAIMFAAIILAQIPAGERT
ncbi:MAG: DMT family transporter [Lachnospiraceae bacterium]|nr:DMT family transporter [Lachnospiraceae bacterium]